jgi:translation initiation factor IF-2
LELKANPDKLSNGHVVEAKIDPGRGTVATVLVQEGTLRVGDSVVCGIHYGKVRAILSDKGRMIKSAGPSMPVEIVGLSGVPNAGDDFIALSEDKNAKPGQFASCPGAAIQRSGKNRHVKPKP